MAAATSSAESRPSEMSALAQLKPLLVVDYFIPTSLAGRLFSISNAFGDYQEAKRMKGPVKTIYVLILLMVALLVIFIGFWFGMTMARDITDPILGLAEGTEKIAAGDLDVYIEPTADDELGVLVRSFNKMTADLRKGRTELMRVNTDLESRRKYMETVLKNVAAGVLSVDAEGKVTTINNSAVRLLGIIEREPLGRPLLEVLPPVSGAAVGEILEHLGPSDTGAIEREVTISFPEKAISLICFANSLRDEDGRDLGVVLVLEDMSLSGKSPTHGSLEGSSPEDRSRDQESTDTDSAQCPTDQTQVYGRNWGRHCDLGSVYPHHHRSSGTAEDHGERILEVRADAVRKSGAQ